MTDEKIKRVRAAAAELEAAINDLGGVRVNVECGRWDVTQIDDQARRWKYILWVDVGGETVTVYP